MDRKIDMDEVCLELKCIVGTLSIVAESFSGEAIPKKKNSVDEENAAICFVQKSLQHI